MTLYPPMRCRNAKSSHLKGHFSASRAARRRSRRARRGVVLLLVVTLLLMFLLIGVTGVIVATTFRTSAEAASKQTRFEVRNDEFSDRIVMQLIRGTDPRSALWGHDLLADLYGNDGIAGTVQAISSDSATVGQFVSIDLIFPTASISYSAPDCFVGRVFTFLDGPNQGKSSRVTRFDVVNLNQLSDGTPNNQIVYRLAIDSQGSAFNVSGAVAGNRILINGAPFNGTGAGYKTSLSLDENGVPRDASHMYPDDANTLYTLNQTLPFNHDGNAGTAASQIHTVLLPNYRAYVSSLPPSLNPVLGGADEPYDSVSLQDMALSWTPSNVSPVTPIIPSFYRYQLIRYLRDVIFTNDTTLDGDDIGDQDNSTAFINTSFTDLSPAQLNAFWNVMNKAILRPMQNLHPNFTGGNSSWSLFPSPTVGPKLCTVREYLTQLAGDPGSTFQLDADTDGDQIPDAIWIDPGLPVQTARDGRRFKVLAAIQVRDLNASLNVNAMTSGRIINTPLQPLSPVTLQSLATQMPEGRGDGYGPAEITPKNSASFGQDGLLLQDALQLLQGVNNPVFGPIMGRYGDLPDPAMPGASLTNWAANHGTNLVPKLKVPGYYGALDLLGFGQLGFDHDGQPLYVNQTLALQPSWPEARPERSPYAFDPLRRNQKFDLPFTESELERMWRKYDVDGSINPGRLQLLAASTAFGADATGGKITNDPYGYSSPLRALTSISVHIPTPGNLPAPELRRTGAASPGSTYYAQVFTAIYQSRLTALINNDPSNSTPLDQKVALARKLAGLVIPFELRHGYPMNVNRAFGNGVDDNGNGTIDEMWFNGAPGLEDAGALAFVDASNPSGLATTFPAYGGATSNFINGEAANGNGNVIDPRVLYARHLYCSAAFCIAQSNGNPYVYPTASGNPLGVTLRRLAQWAINCAEFRDPDGIMTAFEYDVNPFDGWDVDGNPQTMVDATGTTVAGVETTAGLVWGCEQPELMITEALLLHDRRVADTTDDPSGRSRSSSNPDPDLDQVKFPQGSLYLEFYCPRPRQASPANSNPSSPVNLVQYGAFPAELYNINPATGSATLDLARMAPPQPGAPATARPVWRVGISDVLKDRAAAAPMPPYPPTPTTYFNDPNNTNRDLVTYQPEEMIPGDPPLDGYTVAANTINIEREVWFTAFNPVTTLGMTATQAQGIFYNRYSTSNAQLAPGGYLVVGPRTSTYIGSDSQQALQFQYRSNFANPPAANDLELLVTDTTNTKTGGVLAPIPTDPTTGIGNVQNFDAMVCAANLPSTWQQDSTPRQSLVVVRDVNGDPAVKGVGLNATMPLPNSTLGYWAAENEPNTSNEELMDSTGAQPEPRSVPLDEDPNSGSILLNSILLDQQQSTATFMEYKAAFLQRLANPLLPWNPVPTTAQPNPTGYNSSLPLNPYLTVDWMPLDLTVFNGEDRRPNPPPAALMGAEWDPYDAASGGLDMRFSTREKGFQNAAAPFRNPMPWSYETTEPPVSTENADATTHFRYHLRHTLGFLNDAFANPSDTLAPQPRKYNMAGSPLYNGSPQQPFPWLAWYNHNFSSPGEVLLVPASSAGRLFHEYGDVQKLFANNENPNGVYTPLATSIRSASADYAINSTTFYPNGDFLPFPHLLNFFQVSKGLTVNSGTATYTTSVAPDFSRLLDLLGMPGPFMGAEQWYHPVNFASAPANSLADGYRPPFNYLPNFRDAGRLNLNTLGDYDSSIAPSSPVWDALTANLPYNTNDGTGSPNFNSFNMTRRGIASPGVLLNSATTDTPEIINNPFRPANAADLFPDFSLPRTGVVGDTTWGGKPMNQYGGSSEVGLLRRDPNNLNRPLFHLASPTPTPPSTTVPANPAMRLHALNRLYNLTTNQANCYAVWISLGRFEVTYVGPSPQIPDGYQLGAELGFEDGTQQRNRSFFVIDRSIPVAYETGKNHNAGNTILLRKFLE